MYRAIIASLLLFSTTAIAAFGASPTPGKIATFKDWSVGCDNGLSCQAVALLPDGPWDDGLSMVITRSSGVQAPLAIEVGGFAAKANRYRVIIDGKPIHNGAVPTGSESIKIEGAESLKIARAMAKGLTFQLVDGTGANLGKASLSGVAAALRYIDAEQGRDGSRGAVIAFGAKKAMAKKVPYPVLRVRKIEPTNLLPDATALVALSEGSPCAAERMGSTEDTAYSLGGGAERPQALIMLNCGAGAYNFSSGIYVGQRSNAGKWTFEPAKFDYGATGFSDDSKIPLVVNADWDATKQTISSYSKGRGLGDCGSSESWVWDGDMFRLTNAALMGECRGSLDWIPIWRADIKYVK
ncbi:MAG: DUF1176 domain-containing protein [Sphingorhabdus sp.]|uniref:DUF1176 domain-containing protein n=1 Tax=Sphingorhabdus sp. TaxID=1902408 RepID=UPI0038FC1D86